MLFPGAEAKAHMQKRIMYMDQYRAEKRGLTPALYSKCTTQETAEVCEIYDYFNLNTFLISSVNYSSCPCVTFSLIIYQVMIHGLRKHDHIYISSAEMQLALIYIVFFMDEINNNKKVMY